MWIKIAGGYHYQPHHGGVILRAPDNAEVFFQPGDDAARFYADLDAVDISDKPDRGACILFGEYFQ